MKHKKKKTEKRICGAIPCGVCDTRIPCASSLDTEELSCHHQPFDGHQNLKKEPTYNSMQRKTPRSRRKEERQIYRLERIYMILWIYQIVHNK
mmetsp:Transcript_35261/g.74461  ORF Transcript_35261/g.74461 Transcript_35261/m.74461 type:complete len:93 (+) Transcript_35261:681-959(+)